MKKYFNLTYQNYSPLDITQYENKIIKLVTDIENKIFEKV